MSAIVCWLFGHVWIKHSREAKRWSLDARLSWPRWCSRCGRIEPNGDTEAW